MKIDNTTIVVLAGGLGTRLRSVVSDRPKVIAKINGEPFIMYLFDYIIKSGGENVILCTGFKSDLVEITLGSKYQSLKLLYSKETKALGTAGALRNAETLITSKTVIVFNGDSFCDIALQDVLQCHYSRGALCTMVIVRVPDVSRYGHVRYDKLNIITSFEEKGTAAGAGWINAGIYIIDYKLISSIPDNEFMSLEKDIFPSIIGDKLYAYPTEGRFIDIGTPESYAIAADFFCKENMRCLREL